MVDVYAAKFSPDPANLINLQRRDVKERARWLKKELGGEYTEALRQTMLAIQSASRAISRDARLQNLWYLVITVNPICPQTQVRETVLIKLLCGTPLRDAARINTCNILHLLDYVGTASLLAPNKIQDASEVGVGTRNPNQETGTFSKQVHLYYICPVHGIVGESVVVVLGKYQVTPGLSNDRQ